MTTRRGEIFVGDVGTVYFYPTYDDDLMPANFDPSAATTKTLTFKMPGANGLCVRAATAAQETINDVSVWGLRYTVLPADVAVWSSESIGGFHQAAGKISMQGYVAFSASQEWHGSPVATDQQGRRLKVADNLSV